MIAERETPIDYLFGELPDRAPEPVAAALSTWLESPPSAVRAFVLVYRPRHRAEWPVDQ